MQSVVQMLISGMTCQTSDLDCQKDTVLLFLCWFLNVLIKDFLSKQTNVVSAFSKKSLICNPVPLYLSLIGVLVILVPERYYNFITRSTVLLELGI